MSAIQDLDEGEARKLIALPKIAVPSDEWATSDPGRPYTYVRDLGFCDNSGIRIKGLYGSIEYRVAPKIDHPTFVGSIRLLDFKRSWRVFQVTLTNDPAEAHTDATTKKVIRGSHEHIGKWSGPVVYNDIWTFDEKVKYFCTVGGMTLASVIGCPTLQPYGLKKQRR